MLQASIKTKGLVNIEVFAVEKSVQEKQSEGMETDQVFARSVKQKESFFQRNDKSESDRGGRSLLCRGGLCSSTSSFVRHKSQVYTMNITKLSSDVSLGS